MEITTNKIINKIDIEVRRITCSHFVLRDVPLWLNNMSLMKLVGHHMSVYFNDISLIHNGIMFETYMPEEHHDLKRFYKGHEKFVIHAILRLGAPRRKICREEPMKEKECVVCYKNINIRWFLAIHPCMHTVCKDCGAKIKNCPMCRGDIRNLVRVGDVPDRINVYL